jgi:hypothetical protein
MAQKEAVQQMKRGVDGRQKLVFVDIATGLEIPYGQLQSDNYRVITASGEYYDPTPDTPEEEKTNTELNPLANKDSDRRGEGGQKERQSGAGYAYATSQANKSYKTAAQQYVNKPGWMKYASMIPGPIGKVALGVNTAININNVGAVNEARKSMGLEPLSTKDAVKGAFKDRQGQIASVDVNGATYQVGFEALDPYGRTNMTPEEASKRALANNVSVEEVATTKPANAKKGLLSRAKDAVLGVPDSPETRALAAPVGISQPLDDENIGGVSVMSDQEVADRQWADAETVTHPNAPDKTSQFSALDPDQFNNGINEALSARNAEVNSNPGRGISPGGTVVAGGPMSRPGNPNVSQLERDLNSRHELENIKDGSMAGPTGVSAISPSVDTAGFGQIGGAGVRSGFATGTQPGVAPRGAVNAGITGFDMGGINGATNPANTASAQNALGFNASQPSASRYGYDPGGISKSTKSTVNPVSGMQMASSGPDAGRFGGATLSPLDHQSVLSGPTVGNSYAKNTVASSVKPGPDRFAGVDLATASPAKMASLGLVSRTQEEREALARTFAGELSPSSLKGILSGDPVAQRELANMVASAENRIAAEKYGTVDAALVGSQYNSNLPSKIGTTNTNYSIYGDALNSTISGFYDGTLTPDDYGINAYHAAAMKNPPSWSDDLLDAAITGEHKFGALTPDSPTPDASYMPGDAFNAMRDSYAKAQISDTRGWTPTLGGAPSRTSTGGVGSDYAASRAAYDGAIGAGRGISAGGPSIGASGKSTSTGGSGKSATSTPGNSVSGASRSTAGKGGATPSAKSGGQSGAAQSGVSGKTSGSTSSKSSSTGKGGSEGASERSGGAW